MTANAKVVSPRIYWAGERGRTEEGNGFPAVEETVVVGQCDDHDRADDDLAVHNNGSVLNGMHACGKNEP